MTKAQRETLNKVIEKYDYYKSQYLKGKYRYDNAWWVELIKKDIIEIKANTKTLKALEKLGYIEIVGHEDGCCGCNYDYVKLIKRN